MPLRKGQFAGDKHPRWKGGRTISTQGYVLLKQPGHHLADSRGYVVEHKLVAEEMIGRRLRKGEIVHHKNEQKQDNRPSNLVVLASEAEHKMFHRKTSTLRKLGEPNRKISCACGCRQRFYKYDALGRPRRYVHGHNTRRK